MVEPKRWRQRIWRGLMLLAVAAPGVSGAAAADSVVTYHGALNRSGLYEAPGLTWAKAATVRLDAGFLNASVDRRDLCPAARLYWVPSSGVGRGPASSSPPKTTRSMRSTPARRRMDCPADEPRDAGSGLEAAVRQYRPDGRHRHADDRSEDRDRFFGSVCPDVKQRPAPHGVRPFAGHGRCCARLADRRRRET